jgi:hypothetical protein
LTLKALAVFQDFSSPSAADGSLPRFAQPPKKTGFQFNELEYLQLFLVFCVEKGSKEYS